MNESAGAIASAASSGRSRSRNLLFMLVSSILSSKCRSTIQPIEVNGSGISEEINGEGPGGRHRRTVRIRWCGQKGTGHNRAVVLALSDDGRFSAGLSWVIRREEVTLIDARNEGPVFCQSLWRTPTATPGMSRCPLAVA